MLASTDRLGFPGEAFLPDVIRTFSLAFSDLFSSYEAFLVSRHRSGNGVFGIEIESGRFEQEPEFFADVKHWRHVYIWREDVLAQAVSYQIMLDTNVWHSFSGTPQDEKFHHISRDAIVGKFNFLLGTEQSFLNFFRDYKLSPYRLSYEELVSDPVGQVQQIAAHIGIDPSDLNMVSGDEIMLQPTAKARNEHHKALVIGEGGSCGAMTFTKQVDGIWPCCMASIWHCWTPQFSGVRSCFSQTAATNSVTGCIAML